MTYLDYAALDAMDTADFQAEDPYPWANPTKLLTDDGFARLHAALPDHARMNAMFGVARSHGQQTHDYYSLDYEDNLDIARPWHDFVAELKGDRYRGFIRRLFGVESFDFSLHWRYTPSGCSVSPHCDAKHKAGSHIFYFNTDDDWRQEWGGETIILDDAGRMKRSSAPSFEDFERAIPSRTIGNRSLLFACHEHSWHGVREINCPEGSLRRVFIVVINRLTAQLRLRRLIGNRPKGI